MSKNSGSIAKKETKVEQLKLRPAVSKQSSREALTASKLTIVNTKQNGKRIAIAPEVIEKIGSPASVQIAFHSDGMAIGEDLALDDNRFHLRTSGKKSVIYSSELVLEITKLFDLDFTNKTSISYQDVTFASIGGKPVAVITLKGKPLDKSANGSESEQPIPETEATELEQFDDELAELEPEDQ